MDWPTVIAILTLLLGSGGFLFYSQKKASMEIANAAALAAEWEKLYREQKAEREENDNEVASIRPYICYDSSCPKRIAGNQQKNLEK